MTFSVNVDMSFSKKLKIIQEGYKFLLENPYPVISLNHEEKKMLLRCLCNYNRRKKFYEMEVEDGIPRYQAYIQMGNAIFTEGHPDLTEVPFDPDNVLPYQMQSVTRGSVLTKVEKLFVFSVSVEDYLKKDETLPKLPQFIYLWEKDSVCVYWKRWSHFCEYCQKRKKPMIFKDDDGMIKNLQAPL